MTTPTPHQVPSRTKFWLIAALLVLSTVLFVVGVAMFGNASFQSAFWNGSS